MPNPEFTEDDFETLRQLLLDNRELEPRQRELLAFAYFAAREQASQERETVAAKSLLIKLHKQFSRAFCPSDKSVVILEAKIRIKPPPPP